MDNIMERLRLTSIVKGPKADLIADKEVRANSILFAETDTNKVKFADGSHTYAELPYIVGALDDGDGAVYRFKGSVEKFSDLPTENNKAGDTYDVKEDGKNYAWTVDEKWDDIGGTIDLSDYVKQEDLTEATNILDGKISEETTARQEADSALSANIEAVLGDLSDETLARSTRDSELTNMINGEISAREEAISDLGNTYYNKTEIDTTLENFYTKSDVYNKEECNEKFLTEHQDISSKADKSTVDNHIANINNPHSVTKEQIGLGNVENTSDADKPISTATQTALNLKANTADVYSKSDVYTKNEVDAKLTSAMRFKGTKPTYADLPSSGNQVGDMWNVLDTDDNYAWDGSTWDKLSKTIDLSDYATKTDLFDVRDDLDNNINGVIGDLAIETSNRKNLANRIWQNYDEDDASKGWFYTKHNSGNGSFALLFNEYDGGGSQVFDQTANVISYVGTNLEEGSSASDSSINVQIYSKDKTSNEGVRININTGKAYYLKGAVKTNSDARELAVIENIPTTTSQLTNDSDYTTNEALQAQVATLTQQIKDLKLLIPNEVFDATTARSAMNASGKVTLCEDIDLGVLNIGGGMFANYNTSINLNGHTLQSGPTGGRALLLVRGTSNYTFNGKGEVIDTANDSSPVWCASQNASVTINDGTFIAQGHTECIYCELGTITINGGEFKTGVDDKRYLLNCKDANYQAGTAKIIVKGGKFWDFDPHNNTAEGSGTNFCADGYTTISEEIDGHIVYTVVKA